MDGTEAIRPATGVIEPCTIGRAVALAAAPSADAELIEMCDEYVTLDREYCRLSQLRGPLREDDPDCAHLDAAMVVLSHRIEEVEAKLTHLPARTPAGVRAKAEAALHAMAGDADTAESLPDDVSWLAWSALFDAAGRTIA
jgi:hypothetical protein